MIFLFSIILAFLLTVLVMLTIIYIRKKIRTDIFKRMRWNDVENPKIFSQMRETIWQSVLRVIKQIAKPLQNKNWFAPLDLKLKRSGLSLTGAEYIVMNLIAMISVGVSTYMITVNRNFSVAVTFFVPIIIWAVVLYFFRKHKNAFTEQLGDCLVTISNALRAGYSFQQAIEVVGREMEDLPISKEFRRTYADIRMGMTLEDALEQMNLRVDSLDFTLVVTAVLIQREVGGNLAQILDTISDTIMERIRMKREINSLTAQGRLSSIILLVLPFVLGVFAFIINPDQMSVFFEETIGKILLISSVIMDILGFILIQKIVDIDA